MKFAIIILLAFASAYGISFLPERLVAIIMLGGPLLLLVLVLTSISWAKEGEAAVVPAGSIIQWRDMVGGRSPSWWVFFPVEGDQTRYYKVYDHNLYLMGVGYTISKDYEGVLVDRP